MARSRFEMACAAFERLTAELSAIREQPAEAVCASWKAIKREYQAMLADPHSKVTRSAIASGIEQGLRELPLILRDLPEPSRRLAAIAYDRALRAEHPLFLEMDRQRLSKVLTRGRIRTESDYYLVRHHIDLLEGASTQQEQLPDLYRLIEEFDGRSRSRTKSQDATRGQSKAPSLIVQAPDRLARATAASIGTARTHGAAMMQVVVEIDAGNGFGGGSVFVADCDSTLIQLSWLDNETLQIAFPTSALIKQQRAELFYSGRTIHVRYVATSVA